MKRNISTDNIYYYLPKTKRNTMVNSSSMISQESLPKKPLKKLSFTGILGSSTFDYLNKINQLNPKYPKISNIFLTKNLRHKNSLDNIKRENINKKLSINPDHKLLLSNNCELFPILNKTLMKNRNSLKEVNNRELLGFNNISNEKKIDNDIDTNTKSKSFHNKKSIANQTRYSKSVDVLLAQNEFDSKNNNKSEGMSEYYVNFLYNQIFPKFFFENHDKYNVIDNKLNIFYAENEQQFRENLIKKNKKLRERGKPQKKLIINTKYVSDKLFQIKRKIGFVKGVSDYSIPSIILQKVKYNNKKLKLGRRKKKNFLLPFEEIEEDANRVEKLKTKILGETISINNFHSSKNNFLN